MELNDWLNSHYPYVESQVRENPPAQLKPTKWKEIRLFISSTFVDTQAERDVLIKRVIPTINRKFASGYIRVTPVDLRWGVLAEESKDCQAIQKTCLNQLDKCRQNLDETPWFLGLRTDRYGWVQDTLMPSAGFEQPDLCGWIDKFQEYGKRVSITSMECIHATLPPKAKTPLPNIFFYKRNITNQENIEEDLRWVFDFEYVPENTVLDPQVQYQYNKSNKANEYQRDRNSIDEYAKTLDYVKFSTYNCSYKKGSARYTCKNEDRKSFAVGFVSELDEFATQIENDLTEAIEKNFNVANMSSIPKFIQENYLYETAMEERALKMVGRSDLFDTCYGYCHNALVSNNVMIIHGEPGCGKSTIMAAIANRSVKDMREKQGEFVFVHAVDACPGSNILSVMLKRLQENLRNYRHFNQKETDLSLGCPESVADLKSQCNDLIIESANRYPERKFIFLIDAVNQFHDSLQCWKMWWLPCGKVPPNVRFVISTLNKENGTFDNASRVCPNAIKVAVKTMSYDDRQEMVSASLKHYNKKLTTTDDKFLGNQMQILLGKNESPLYLKAATDALRQFGIFEKVSEYIKRLPTAIPTLFNSLLQEWCKEYGERFIRDLTGFISLSKDGLLENEINELLAFKEAEESFDYECSFSRIYDALSSFLAAGGGGFLRFFHDQLKYEVQRKFLTPKVERELNTSLINFYLNCIVPQLVDNPLTNPPTYYNHCLQEVVYHQLLLPQNEVNYANTLRNIYFVRERIQHGQGDLLKEEYIEAIRRTVDDTNKNALKQWERFARIYFSYINSYPELAFNLALNQPASSSVSVDSKRYPVPTKEGLFPLYWENPPDEESNLLAKYTADEPAHCNGVSSKEENLCCVGFSSGIHLYEIDSSILVNQIIVSSVSAIYFSKKHKTLWTGNKDCIIAWNTETGTEEWTFKTSEEILWIDQVDGYIACGTGHRYRENFKGVLYLMDEDKQEMMREWVVATEGTLSYCYLPKYKHVLSGHVGSIKCWDLNGILIKTLNICHNEYFEWVCCLSVCPEPGTNKFAIVLREDELLECLVVEYNYENEDYTLICDGTGECVTYNENGTRLICPINDKKNVGIFDLDGTLINTLKGHSNEVNTMRVIPGSGNLLTAAGDGCIVFDVGQTPVDSPSGDENTGLPFWCCFLLNGEYYATLRRGENVQVLYTDTNELIATSDSKIKLSGAAIYPNGKYILAHGQWDLIWLDSATLEIVNTYEILSEDHREYIEEIVISPDSSVAAVLTTKRLHILGLKNPQDIIEECSLTDRMNTYDIHKDNIQLITGYSCGIRTYDLKPPQVTYDIHKDNIQLITGYSCGLRTYDLKPPQVTYRSSMKDKSSLIVKYLYNPDRIFYLDTDKDGHIMDMNGVALIAFDHTCKLRCQYKSNHELRFLQNNTLLMTANGDDKTIRVHDVKTGKLVYTFYEHRSTLFTCIAVNPQNSMVIAGNQNKMFYKLRNSKSIYNVWT